MSITVDQLDLFGFDENAEEFGGYYSDEAKAARRRERRRRNAKADYRTSKINVVPVKNGIPFCIVPEVAPILASLAATAAREAGLEVENDSEKADGVGILGARAAIVLGKTEGAVVRRLHAVMHKRQLFINAPFIEACLMAMDAEHEFRYSEWPSCRADALERVSIEAEMAGKNVSPTKLLARSNRLYEKGVRKALKRAVEVRP